MKYLKSILLTFAILTFVLGGYIFFSFDSGYTIREALQAYRHQDLATAKEQLSKLNPKRSAQHHLYSGFIFLDENRLDDALRSFEKALTINQETSLKPEIIAALQLTYYLKNDIDQVTQLQESSTLLYPKQVFEFISSFKQNSYQKAEDIFKTLPSFDEGRNWLQLAYCRHVPSQSLGLIYAHCLVENNRFFEAKEVMRSFAEDGIENEGYYHFLMGLSFAKEAESKSVNLAVPYYKLAFQQFKKIDFSKKEHSQFKTQICDAYINLIGEILNASLYSELNHFIDFLGELDAKASLVSDKFFSHIKKEISSNNQSLRFELLCQSLAYCHQSLFQERLKDALFLYLEQLVKNQNIEAVKKAWPFYTQIAHEMQEAQAMLITVLEKQIKQELSEQDFQPLSLVRFIELLSALNINTHDYSTLIDNLSLNEKQSELFSRLLSEFLFATKENSISEIVKEFDQSKKIEETNNTPTVIEVNPTLSTPEENDHII